MRQSAVLLLEIIILLFALRQANGTTVRSGSVRWSFHPPGSAFFLRPLPSEQTSGLTRRFYVHAGDLQPELRAQFGPLHIARPALASPPPTPAHVRPSVHVANPRSVVTAAASRVHYLCHIDIGEPSPPRAKGGGNVRDSSVGDYCCFVRTILPRPLRNKAVYSVCEVNRNRKYCYMGAALPDVLWRDSAQRSRSRRGRKAAAASSGYYDLRRRLSSGGYNEVRNVRASFVLLPRQPGGACGSEPPPLPLGAAFRPVQGAPVWLVQGGRAGGQGAAVVREDKDVLLVVPRRRVRPGEKVEVAVKLVNNSNLVEFTLSVSIGRDHFTVIDAVKPSNGEKSWTSQWTVTTRMSRQNQTAEVTARLLDRYFHKRPKKEQRIFDVFFFVRPTSQRKHNRVKVDWALLQTRYRDSQVRRSSAAHSFSTEINVGENSLINIVPILKDTNLINTAILDGKTLRYPLHIFALSRYYTVQEIKAGRCTCHSNEGAILRVDRGCRFVYLDGREKYGGWNITLIVKYSQYTAYLNAHVWVPERHVHMELSDSELNLIRGWRVPRRNRRFLRTIDQLDPDVDLDDPTNLAGVNPDPGTTFFRGPESGGPRRKKGRRRRLCGKLFQRAHVSVYTRFLTHRRSDPRSASYRRIWRYLVGPQALFDVTGLVASQLGVDSSGWGPGEAPVADIQGEWLVGRSKGRAMVKLSVKGIVIGNASFAVSQKRVRISDVRVEPITALRSFVTADPSSEVNQVRLQPLNAVNNSRTDAFLHLRVFFSDGTMLSLADPGLSNLPLSWDAVSPKNVLILPGGGIASATRLWPRMQVVGGGTPEVTVWLEQHSSCRARGSRGRLIGAKASTVIGGPPRPPRPLPPVEPPMPPRSSSKKNSRARLPPVPPKEEKKTEVPKKRLPTVVRDKELFVKKEEEPVPERAATSTAQMPPLPSATPAVLAAVSTREGVQEDEPKERARPPSDSQFLQGPSKGGGKVTETGTTLTGMEIGMYVLLTVFCVAATVFAVNCGLMLARYQRRRMCRRTEGTSGSKEGPILSPVYEHGNLVGTREARNWVWLRPPGSKDTSEDKRPLSLASSQLPSHSLPNTSLPRSCVSATGVSHSATATAHLRQQRQSVAGLASLQQQQQSAPLAPRHYQGDECSIRIVNNPMPLHVAEGGPGPSGEPPRPRASIASPSSTRSAPPPSFPPPPPPPLSASSGRPPAPPQRTTSCRGATGHQHHARGHHHSHHGGHHHGRHHGLISSTLASAPASKSGSAGSSGSPASSTMRGWDRHLRALPVEQRFALFNNMKESVA